MLTNPVISHLSNKKWKVKAVKKGRMCWKSKVHVVWRRFRNKFRTPISGKIMFSDREVVILVSDKTNRPQDSCCNRFGLCFGAELCLPLGSIFIAHFELRARPTRVFNNESQ